MAKIELKGFDAYLRQLVAIGAKAVPVCKAAVFPGAAILAEKIRAEVDALPTISDAQAKGNFRSGEINTALSESQKAGLQASLGITPIRRDRKGMIQASVGFSDYNTVITRHFPKGQPNAEVARSIEKGTSYLQRNAFVSRAIRAAKKEATAAMAAEADRQIERIMRENGG